MKIFKINSYIAIVIAFFTIVKFSYSSEVCYKVRYLFIEVGKLCIEYKIKNGKIFSYAEAKTTGIVKLLKDIEYKGKSIASLDYKPEKFFFFQKERNLKIIHQYIFNKNEVLYKKIKNKKEEIKKINIGKKEFFDAFTAGLYIFKEKSPQEKKIKVFFNGKLQDVKYRITKTDKDKIIRITAKVNVEGLIKPTGEWKVYIRNGNLYPYKMEIKIRIGEVEIYRYR